MNHNDCCSEPKLKSFENALASLLEYASSIKDVEHVPIQKVNNRCLAQDIQSPINVPAFTNSAMDGYAFNCEDLTTTSLTLNCVGQALAGAPYARPLGKSECIRIMTGAKLPENANAVEMQENVIADGSTIQLSRLVPLNQHVRFEGEDISIGQNVLLKHQRIKPSDVALLASLGLQTVQVFRKLRVAMFSTGDELQVQGQPLAEGQIYDSNRITILAILEQLNIEIKDMGIIKDSPESIELALVQANEWADIVMTSGGVSVGDADYVKSCVEKLGTLHLWKIAMKPGKPFAYGQLNKSHFIGLPGNPVSALVTCYQLAVPFIETLMGGKPTPPFKMQAKSVNPIKKRVGRLDFQRGVAFINDNGELSVDSTGPQGSGLMTSFSLANCFICLKEDQGNVAQGDTVEIQMFNRLLQ